MHKVERHGHVVQMCQQLGLKRLYDHLEQDQENNSK